MSGSSSRTRPADTGAAGLSRAVSAAQQRLQRVSAEHERLLRDIRTRQRRLADIRRLRADLYARFALELEPKQRLMRGLVAEIQRLFTSLLGPERAISRRHRSELREFYTAFCQDFEWLQAEEQPPQRQDSASHRVDVGEGAFKPDSERAGALHALFRRLVNAVHPDKVQEPAEKEQRTALMKVITRAYEASDLAGLLQFEELHLARVPIVDDAASTKRRTQELTAANAELRGQFRLLAHQLKVETRWLPLEPTNAETSVDQRFCALLDTWQQQNERLQSTRDSLLQFENGNLSALDFLDHSWALDQDMRCGIGNSANQMAAKTTPVEVNESNIGDVLTAFNQRLRQALKR